MLPEHTAWPPLAPGLPNPLLFPVASPAALQDATFLGPC